MTLSLLLSVVIVGVKALEIVVGFSLLTEGYVHNYSTKLVPLQYNPSVTAEVYFKMNNFSFLRTKP